MLGVTAEMISIISKKVEEVIMKKTQITCLDSAEKTINNLAKTPMLTTELLNLT